MHTVKTIFNLSLLCFLFFLFCSKIYSNDRELIVNEIKNIIEFNQDISITDSIKLFYTENLYEPYWQNNKSKISDLLGILTNSYKEGIPTNRYEIQKINNLNFSKKESDIAKLDIILTKISYYIQRFK